MSNRLDEASFEKFETCYNPEMDGTQRKRNILELAEAVFSDDYDEWYNFANALFRCDYHDEKKNKRCDIAEILVDEIIEKRPYFHEPEIYYVKLSLLSKKWLEKSFRGSEEYEKEERYYVEKFFISYMINIADEDTDDHGADGIILDYFPESPGKDACYWAGIKVLQKLSDFCVSKKAYREGNTDILHPLMKLANIYLAFEGDKSKDYLKYQCLWEVFLAIQSFYDSPGAIDDFGGEEGLLTLQRQWSDEPLVYYGLGRFYFENGEIDQARFYLEKSFELNVDEWYAYFLLGQVYLSKNDFVNAEIAFKAMLESYDEANMEAQIEDVKELLNPINGGSIDYRKILDRRADDNCGIFTRSKNSTLDFYLKTAAKEIRKQAEESIGMKFGKYHAELHRCTKNFLVEGEKAFLWSENDKIFFERRYMEFVDALGAELYHKVFNPFRVNYHGKFQKNYKRDMGSLKDAKELFYRFMNEKDFTPTLGQMLGFLSKEKLAGHLIYESFCDHINIVSPILNDKEYIDEVKELVSERNKDAHPENYDKRAKYYLWVRNSVLGTKEREGVLIRVIKNQ